MATTMQPQTSTAAVAITLAGTQAPTRHLSFGVSKVNPALIKAKELDLLAVEEDPVALWVEDSQVGVFQEEDHQQEPQEEEL